MTRTRGSQPVPPRLRWWPRSARAETPSRRRHPGPGPWAPRVRKTPCSSFLWVSLRVTDPSIYQRSPGKNISPSPPVFNMEKQPAPSNDLCKPDSRNCGPWGGGIPCGSAPSAPCWVPCGGCPRPRPRPRGVGASPQARERRGCAALSPGHSAGHPAPESTGSGNHLSNQSVGNRPRP